MQILDIIANLLVKGKILNVYLKSTAKGFIDGELLKLYVTEVNSIALYLKEDLICRNCTFHNVCNMLQCSHIIP